VKPLKDLYPWAFTWLLPRAEATFTAKLNNVLLLKNKEKKMTIKSNGKK